MIVEPVSYGKEYFYVASNHWQYQAINVSPCYSTPEEAEKWLEEHGDKEKMSIMRAQFLARHQAV